jgi:hypothetical protein
MAGDPLGTGDLVYRSSLTNSVAGPLAGVNKLWLSIWSGETIHAYDEYNMFESLVESRTINNGVSMEFPVTGTVALKAAWEAGQELVGNTTDAASTTFAIKLDKRPIAAHFEIDNIDLMQTQWEFRSELARQAGMTLSNARDKQIAAYIARAAMEGPLSDDPRSLPAGPVFLSPLFDDLGALINTTANSAARSAAALEALKACEDFVVYLQNINAPTDGVYLAVTPRAFQDIRALGVARSGDAQSILTNMQPMFGGVASAGGLGAALTQGMNNITDSLEYMGVRIVKSNHLPVANFSGVGEARYNLTFGTAGIVGIIFQKSCVASLKLQGLKVDTVDDIRRNTTFTVASMMAGTGVLRPECAAVLVGPTTDNTGAWSVGGGNLFANATTINTEVNAAHTGGSTATLARAELRTLTGMSAEYITIASNTFPYTQNP